MAASIGASSVLFRVGSAGPAKVFLGDAAIQTVPGQPDVFGLLFELSGGSTLVDTPAEPANGGSAITGYAWYIDGVPTLPASDSGSFVTFSGDVTGAEIRVAAVNAIGTGQQSDPYSIPL